MKKNNKKKYIKPIIEVITISKDEIISTSGANSFGGSYLSGKGYKF